jgi:hypothetical protein
MISLKGHCTAAPWESDQVHGGFITVSKIGVVGWRGKKTDPDAQFHLEAHPDGGSNGRGWMGMDGDGWLVNFHVGFNVLFSRQISNNNNNNLMFEYFFDSFFGVWKKTHCEAATGWGWSVATCGGVSPHPRLRLLDVQP